MREGWVRWTAVPVAESDLRTKTDTHHLSPPPILDSRSPQPTPLLVQAVCLTDVSYTIIPEGLGPLVTVPFPGCSCLSIHHWYQTWWSHRHPSGSAEGQTHSSLLYWVTAALPPPEDGIHHHCWEGGSFLSLLAPWQEGLRWQQELMLLLAEARTSRSVESTTIWVENTNAFKVDRWKL